ncbi:hypothetical protein MRB53_024910 [Persea americana]|uniref:Uncharacterized protein n=1 Tax=Persea americana TaxID=3435 RepID=A0ACC2LDK0_PERAE|nr:hypothetical protein MRB53_024910 [Persea americana]
MPSTLSPFQTFLPSQIAFSMPLLGEATKRAPTGGDKTCTAGSFSLPSIHSRTSSGQDLQCRSSGSMQSSKS